MRALGGDLVWMRANWGADHRDPLLLTRPRASSAFEWLRPAVSAEGWDFVSLRDPGPGAAELLGLESKVLAYGNQILIVLFRIVRTGIAFENADDRLAEFPSLEFSGCSGGIPIRAA